MDDLEKRLAAAFLLIVREGHPLYGSTATWHGGIGGAAMTLGCNFKDPAPGSEWFQDIEGPLRDWLHAHEGEIDLFAEADALRAELAKPWQRVVESE